MRLLPPDILQERFATVRKELTAALIERDDEVDVLLTALIGNEHALLVGNPGVDRGFKRGHYRGRR